MAHVVVVESDIVGLACAARLQSAGHRVTVASSSLEPNADKGRFVEAGFRIPLDPSPLTLPAAFVDLFTKTGKPLDQCVDIHPAQSGYSVRMGTHAPIELADVGIGSWAEAFGDELGAQSASDWRTAMGQAASMWASIRPSHTTPRAARPRWSMRREPTLRRFSTQTFSDVRLQAFLEWFSLRDGLDPRQVSRSSAVAPYLEQTFGLHEVAGGVASLVDALHQRCETLGVEFEYDSPVTRVVTEDGRVRGVEIAGSEYLTCDVLVHAQPSNGRKPVIVLLGVAGEVDLAARTVWLPKQPENEITALFDSNQRAVDPSITLSVTTDGAPAGSTALTLSVPQGPELTPDEGWYADHLLRVLAQRGIDLRRRVLWQHTVADTTNSFDVPRARGIVVAQRTPVPGVNVSLDALAGEGVLLSVGKA